MKYLAIILVSLFLSSILQGDELRLFALHQAKTPKSSFVDISDQSIFPEQLTLKIKPSKRYRLKKNKRNDLDYHKLSYKKSSKILRILNIKLTDKIFIYNLTLNKVTSFKVQNKMPLLVHQNPYGSGWEGIEYYFGFEIKNRDYPIKNEDYRNNYLVYIGKENPFDTGALTKISWKLKNSLHFPTKIFIREHDLENLDVKNEEYKNSDGSFNYVEKSYEQKSYAFSKGELDYFLYYLTHHKKTIYNESPATHSIGYSYYMQVKKKDGEPIFDRFSKGSEGFFVGSFKDEKNSQWTGEFLKNKPPAYFNSYASFSFGCNTVYLMDNVDKPIFLLCNNRH